MANHDFHITNHGSVYVLEARSPEAQAWVDDNLPEDRMTWGVNGTVIEPRYVHDILVGIVNDGLEVRHV